VGYELAHDGIGNMSDDVDQTGAAVAHFEYDPFGNLTVDSYNNAAAFPYRFSTKPQDGVTGLYYYGYRWFDPVTGRWPSRDPIGERGGANLYGFVGNDGVNKRDFLGLTTLNEWWVCTKLAAKFDMTCCKEALKIKLRLPGRIEARYGGDSDGGVINAIKHCALGCALANRCCSKRKAHAVTSAHEIFIDQTENDGDDRMMDLHNNWKGIELSRDARENGGGSNLGNCIRACEQAALDGRLIWHANDSDSERREKYGWNEWAENFVGLQSPSPEGGWTGNPR
jgi:RHS repeat-associated protein